MATTARFHNDMNHWKCPQCNQVTDERGGQAGDWVTCNYCGWQGKVTI